MRLTAWENDRKPQCGKEREDGVALGVRNAAL
jgi:hypothetical protein